jgi:hypothetical protein
LINKTGAVVAHDGDKLVLDAAIQDPLYPCRDIEVVST